MPTAVMLFTRDLRVHDHPALTAAVSAGAVVPLFVFDDDLLRLRAAPNRVAFLLGSLEDLRASLQALGADLVVRRGDVAAETARVVAETGASTVHLSADVSRWARRREAELQRALAGAGCDVVGHDGVTVVAPGAVVPAGGDHYRVFTPYWRRWSAATWRPVLPPPESIPTPGGLHPGALPTLDDLPSGPGGGRSPRLPPGGEQPGRDRLVAWLAAGADEAAGPETLSVPDASRLGPYLRFGCVSPLEAATQATVAGADEWVRKLAWRDFLHQVTAAFDGISSRDYRPRRRKAGTKGGPDAAAWAAGRTGVPIVDAGLRQLREEGWMPNRARMITASFLTRNLGVDWRVGAEHFWAWLVDGDVANNYGNWQWVAGTGNDTRPNRVLNVLRQARRFDPDGEYVRRWVPELRPVAGGAVHEPWRLAPEVRAGLSYPDPIATLTSS